MVNAIKGIKASLVRRVVNKNKLSEKPFDRDCSWLSNLDSLGREVSCSSNAGRLEQRIFKAFHNINLRTQFTLTGLIITNETVTQQQRKSYCPPIFPSIAVTQSKNCNRSTTKSLLSHEEFEGFGGLLES